MNKLCTHVKFCHFIPISFYFFLKGKQDVKTQSQINDELRWVYFAAWHPHGACLLGARQKSRALHRESGQRRREPRSIWFSIKSIQMTSDLTLHCPDRHTYIHIFASSQSCAHADRWVQLLRTSRCLTYIFNHPHVLHMTYKHARYKTRHTSTQPGFPLTVPRVQGCSEIRV